MMEKTLDKKVRFREYDIAKGIAILSVVIVHIPSEYSFMPFGISWHLSTFFLVSGILEYFLQKEYNLKLFFKKRLNSLIKPYIILSLLYILVYTVVGLITETPINIVRNLYLFVSFSGIGTLWFLPTFFIASVCFYFILHKFKNLGLILLEVLFIALSVLAQKLTQKGICGNLRLNFKGVFINAFVLLLQIFIVAGFIAIGYHFGLLIKKVEEKFSLVFQNLFYSVLGIGFLIISCLLNKYYAGNDLHNLNIKNTAGFIVCTVLGGIAIIFISKVISKIKFFKLFEYCGINSLIIMTTHLEYHVIDLAILLVGMALPLIWLSKFLIFILVVVIELILCFVINKVPILRSIFYSKKVNK